MKKSQPYREEVNIDGKNPEKVLIRMLELFDGRIVGEVTGHVETRIQGLIEKITNHHNGKPIKLTICRENITNPESPNKPRIGAQRISIPLLDPYILSTTFEIIAPRLLGDSAPLVWVPSEISPHEIHAIGALTSAVPIKKDTVKDIYPNDPDHYLDTYKILTTQFPAKNFELDGKERKKYEKYTGGIIFYTTVKKPQLT